MENDKFTMEDFLPCILTTKQQVFKFLENSKRNLEFETVLFLEIISKTTNHLELIEIFDIIKVKFPDFYKNTAFFSENFSESHSVYKKILSIPIGIENNVIGELERALLVSDTGNFIAYLIGLKNQIANNILAHPHLQTIYPRILHEIDCKLKQYSQLLFSNIESQTFFSIETGLNAFFIYEKKEAFNLFMKIFKDNKLHRKYSLEDYEFMASVDVFFKRLQVNFIPIVENLINNSEIIQNNNSEYITKAEIMSIVDYKDIFDKKYPLEDLDHKYFLKPIEPDKEKKAYEVLSTFFKEELVGLDWSRNVDFAQIFLDSLVFPSLKYDLSDLQFVRDQLIEQFEDKDKRDRFLAIMYLFKIKIFDSSSNSLPKILSKYFVKNFSVGNNRKHIIFEENASNVIKQTRKIIENQYFKK